MIDTEQPTSYPLTPRKFDDLVFEDWLDAEICVGDSLGGAKAIQRISFHQNLSGSKIIMLHEKEIEP